MWARTLVGLGAVVGAVAGPLGVGAHGSSDTDSPNEAVSVVAGLTIVAMLVGVVLPAGWCGRDRDDVVIVGGDA